MTPRQACLLLFAWLLVPVLLPAQSLVLSNDLPVVQQGQSLGSPWAGGLNAAQLSTIDLDQDGHLDLLVFDRHDHSLHPFLNLAQANQSAYRYAPEFIPAFPDNLSNWVLLRDFDGDGHQDIFTSPGFASNIRVFRNVTATNGGQLAFSLFVDTLSSNLPPLRYLYSARTDIPAIEDLDGDGDLDILTFDVGGAVLDFHRNLSMENHGNLNFLEFEVASNCYGHYKEASTGCDAELNQPVCGTGQKNDPVPRHAGSTLLALHLNGDSLLDFIVGDIGCDHVYALYQSDTSQVAHFDSAQVYFPAASTPIRLVEFISAFHLDTDNDGLKDLLAAPNQGGNTDNLDGIWRYRNQGTNLLPDFQLVEKGFLQNDMLEVGSGSSAAFFDYNQDGLVDLLLAGLGKYLGPGNGHRAVLKLYENTGTAQQAAFALVDDNYLDLSGSTGTENIEYPIPALGDLDGDGDVDLLLGDFAGGLYHFENTAGAGNTASFSLVTDAYFGINADLYTAPNLADLDGDGDLDLLIGNIRGDIHYYENAGTPSSANFVFVTDTFGGIEITDYTGATFSNGFSRPQVLDYDADGDLEVLVGTVEGLVEVYEDFSLAPGAVFTRVNDLASKDFGAFSTVAGAVLDSSSQLSYVVGQIRGGLMLLRPGGPVAVVEPAGMPALQVLVYPNPSRGTFQWEVRGVRPFRQAVASLYDLRGKLVFREHVRGPGGTVAPGELPEGIYLLQFREGDRQVSHRIQILH